MEVVNDIEFGNMYEDVVTGFKGRAIGFCTYITRCDQVLLAPPVDKDGKRVNGEWFDLERLALLAKEAPVSLVRRPVTGAPVMTGADKPAPIR